MSDNAIDLFQSLSSLSQLKNSCKRNSVVLADERSELVRIQDLQYTFDTIGREVKRGKPISQFIVRIWELAELLRDDDDVWEDFAIMGWSKRQSGPYRNEDQLEPLKWVLRWIEGPTKRGRKRADEYYLALEPLFRRRAPKGILPDIIVAAGGLKAMARAYAKRDAGIQG